MSVKNSHVMTVFDEGIDHPGSSLYTSALSHALRRIFPDPFFFDQLDEERQEEALSVFDRTLPLFKWQLSGDKLSLFLVCQSKFNIGKIFYDLIQQWLLPGQRLSVSFFLTTDFKLVNLSSQVYTKAEMVICLLQDIDRDLLKHNLQIIETEIRLGLISFYHTNRILEVHGVRSGEKQSHIQEKILELIQKRPDEIDYDIFAEMQHFFVMSQDEFKAEREAHHLSRLITLFYLFRKSIQRSLEKEKDVRHIRLKIHPVNLHLPWGIKRVLGICVALNFLKSNELFEERHFIKAVKSSTPSYVNCVPHSFFVNEGGEEEIHTLYLEIEKDDGSDFSQGEIKALGLSLADKLKCGIEVALKPLFMPRNEEEVIRHIVTLSKELRFVKDVPQVILSFDEQVGQKLCFTVILVRILFPKEASIQEKFSQHKSCLTFTPDRVKRVGVLRKKYPKEACVFRVSILSDLYVREDESVDIFKARQSVIEELQKVLGEIRDYNGGMIAKQIESLAALKQSCEGLTKMDELLLENFFHSLFPIEMRSIIPFGFIKDLFLLWKEFLEHLQAEELVQVKEEGIYFMQRQENSLILETFSDNLLIARPALREVKFFGGIYFYKTEQEKTHFLTLRK